MLGVFGDYNPLSLERRGVDSRGLQGLGRDNGLEFRVYLLKLHTFTNRSVTSHYFI